MYVLTSHSTFSGGEEFTFDLKTQKRATIVGETTGGGAHPLRGMSARDHFSTGVPFGRPINPVTKGDWEGTGVEPDVKVIAADALATAEKLAAEKLANKGKPEQNSCPERVRVQGNSATVRSRSLSDRVQTENSRGGVRMVEARLCKFDAALSSRRSTKWLKMTKLALR